MKIAIYNEHCIRAGRRVPDAEVERYELEHDTPECDDWTIYSGTKAELQEIAARLTGHTGATGRHDRRVAATILEDV